MLTHLDPSSSGHPVLPDLEGVADLLVAIKDAARGNPMIQELVLEALGRIGSTMPVLAWGRGPAAG